MRSIALDEWQVSFWMRAASQHRQFTMVVPAADAESARFIGLALAASISAGCEHVWQRIGDVEVTLSAPE